MGDFVGVVHGDMVDTAGVDIKGFAKGFVGDSRTFDMPAGVAGATKVVPAHSVVFTRLNELPEGKIGKIAFFRVEINACAGAKMVEVEASEVGIGGKLGGIKVDAIAGLISVALLGETIDEGEILFDIVGGFGDGLGFG